MNPVESLLISARIRSGHYQKVRDIVDEGPPFEFPYPGISRNLVFMHRDSIVFLFEGPPGLRKVIRGLVRNPTARRQMLRIGTHLEGMPHEFDCVYAWDEARANAGCEEPGDLSAIG